MMATFLSSSMFSSLDPEARDMYHDAHLTDQSIGKLNVSLWDHASQRASHGG